MFRASANGGSEVFQLTKFQNKSSIVTKGFLIREIHILEIHISVTSGYEVERAHPDIRNRWFFASRKVWTDNRQLCRQRLSATDWYA